MEKTEWIIPIWMSLLANQAEASIAMQEREQVQTFVWVLEAATFIMIVAIFWFVWRLSQRAKADRRSRQENQPE